MLVKGAKGNKTKNACNIHSHYVIQTLLVHDIYLTRLLFVPKGPINNIPALVQIMACGRPDDMPLSEPMMIVYWHIFVSPGHNELRSRLLIDKQVNRFISLILAIQENVISANILLIT